MNVQIDWFARVSKYVIAVSLLVVAVGCGSSPTAASSCTAQDTVPFSMTDTVVGTGTAAVAGHFLTVTYTAWFYDATKPNNQGAQFDAGTGFTFVLGQGQVIPGWDQGLVGMKVGGTRILVIPPSLGYGCVVHGSIPANSTLLFQVTLTNVI